MLIYHSVTPGYARWFLLGQFWLRRRNQNSCMVWWGVQEADLRITWAPPPPPNSPSPLSISLSHPVLLPILPITPQWVFFSSLTSTYFFIFPPSFFSLSLSLSLSFIPCSFSVPILLPNAPLPPPPYTPPLPFSPSSPQSSSALAVSSTARRTLFFNRGRDRARERARYRERERSERGCSASDRKRESERASFTQSSTPSGPSSSLSLPPLPSATAHDAKHFMCYLVMPDFIEFEKHASHGYTLPLSPPPFCTPPPTHTHPTADIIPIALSFSVSRFRLHHPGLTSRASWATVFRDISLLNEVLFPGFTSPPPTPHPHLLLTTHPPWGKERKSIILANRVLTLRWIISAWNQRPCAAG